jgi:filamentous hemagglutinin
MPDRNATDLRLGRDTHPPDEPTPADHGDQVAVAPDGGAGGWEAFDDPDAPEPRPATTPDRPERPTATVTPAPDGGAGGWEAFDDPDAAEPQPAADDSTLNPEARRIAGGHAFDKHVIQRGEYPGISTREEFADLIDEVMSHPTDIKDLQQDRTGYWHEGLRTVVITNPHRPDGGTAFRPPEGKDYYDKQLK